MDHIQNINSILSSFKVRATCQDHRKAGHISIYDLVLAHGARVKDIEKFSQEIALALRSKTFPLCKAIPALGIVRLQVIEDSPSKINFFSKVEELKKPKGILQSYLGETSEGNPLWIDLQASPHILIAGSTGSGKSTLLHAFIANALTNSNLELNLIDTKQVEFSQYESINHPYLTIDKSYKTCLDRVNNLYSEMNARYHYMRENNLPGNYFSQANCPHPYTVMVIDEFADLIMQDEGSILFDIICRIAQKGRAAGIHLIIATQRPSADVLKGALKANFPTRISCRVSSRVDSQVILDTPGAQLLFGMGDALIKSAEHDMQRFQCAYASAETVCEQFKTI